MTFITSTTEESVLTLHIAFPPSHGAARYQNYAEAIEALNVAADSAEVRAVVITAGPHCAPRRAEPSDSAERAAMGDALTSLHDWIEELVTFPKPLIAAVEASAAGDHLASLLACDQIVAARHAKFCVHDTSIGGPAAGGVIFHLARAVSRCVVLDLAFDNQPSTAERWHGWGLVSQLVDDGTAKHGAIRAATRLANANPRQLESVRAAIDAAATPGALHDHLLMERTRSWHLL